MMGVSPCDNRCSEHFTRMDQNGVHRSDGNQVVPFDAFTGIEEQHNEAFALGVEVRRSCDVQLPIICGKLWRIAQPHLFRRGAFP